MNLISPELAPDHLSIHHLFARYVHAADSFDIAGLDACFEPDALCDYSASGLVPAPWHQMRESDTFRGRGFWRVVHLYSNFLIELSEDRETARVRSRVICHIAAAAEPNSPVTELLGGYDDVVVRGADGWRFRARTWRPAWTSAGTSVAPPFGE